ncbi:MAG TPA: MFS transporter [Candidatus Cybelea sp.]|nr:MFS transporter [Candidatus Cybelea sp.]
MTESKPQPYGWVIVAMLFMFMFINFVDKVIIGLAGVPIMKDLGITPKEFGIVNSSFFYLFSISAIVTGFIVNHIQARWALLVMALIWALTQFPMIGTVGLGTLMACRIALGAGEGPAYPVALHATYKWFPNEFRTLPTSIIAQGAAIGVVIAVPLLDHVIEEYSWHWAFGLLGVVGLVWVIVWMLVGREGTITVTVAQDTGKSIDHVPYWRLLLNGTVLSGFAAGFGAYWGLSLLVGWFTPYLIQGMHFTQKEASWITTLPWAAGPFIVIFAGWLSQRLMANGVSTRWARGVFGGGCVALGGLALILMPHLPGVGLKVAMVIIGISVPSVIYVMGHAIVSEITPVSQRGAMLAINNAIATSAGLIGPYLMGSVIQDALKSGATAQTGYEQGFLFCGVVALVCGLIGMIFLRPGVEAARFAATARPAAAAAE